MTDESKCSAELWTAAESVAADRHTMDVLAVPSPVLMERAALCVVHEVASRIASTNSAGEEPVVVLVGPGNNGGDGLAIARILHHRGIRVEAFCVTGNGSEALMAQRRQAASYGVTIHDGVPERIPERPVLVVDALLGTGSRGAPRGAIAAALRWAERVRGPTIAVDLPTGVDADTGAVSEPSFTADCTVTFARSKPGLHVTPGRDRAGRVVVADIGIQAAPDQSPMHALIDPDWVVARLAELPQPRHKGHRGHVGVVAGGRNTPGAALLAAAGALRAGAGLLTVATDDPLLRAALVTRHPEIMLAAAGEARPMPRADALVIGPGLTDADSTVDFVQLWTEDERPSLWDASALDRLPIDRAPAAPRIVTPHPGEAARLMARLHPGETWSPAAVQESRLAVARVLAHRLQAVVVLKGGGSVIAHPDGRVAVAVVGGPALATAGSGDTLAGLGAALLARFPSSAWDVARVAVHIHGVAGDLAAHARGPSRYAAPTASDIAEQLGTAQSPEHLRREIGLWPRLRLG